MLDVMPALSDAYRQYPRPLFFDHCHHTSWGSNVIARAVLRFVCDHLAR